MIIEMMGIVIDEVTAVLMEFSVDDLEFWLTSSSLKDDRMMDRILGLLGRRDGVS